ncbi:hypothetical protein HRbin17_00786 [bacterium HR17]|uniref:Uncharacterized protein n=1 Tax=Candidatus Fervidibacter japonicus TaxID=2035412 RepID=A0A2H5XAU6_9BACT|nr:hypothetical protein HRbin17_00786 [bacterium HR17]
MEDELKGQYSSVEGGGFRLLFVASLAAAVGIGADVLAYVEKFKVPRLVEFSFSAVL